MLRVYITLFALVMPALFTAGDSLPAPRQISDHAWAWIGPYGPPTRENGGFRMNLGFVVGDDAVAVIDSGYSGTMAGAMLEQIRRTTDRPVRYVVNTDSQPLPIMGNPVFRRRAGAEVIVGAEAIPRIAGEGPAFAATVAEVLGLPPASVAAGAAFEWSVAEGETGPGDGRVRESRVRMTKKALVAGGVLLAAAKPMWTSRTG